MRRPSILAPRRAQWSSLALASLTFLGLGADATAQRGDRARTILRVGFVHTVDGPTIEDAIVIVQGDKILTIAGVDEVQLPEQLEILDFSTAHAYPGFIDLHSSAFADGELLSDRNVDAGTEIAPGLDAFDEPSRQLVRRGITTAYVHNRSQAQWRGQGAVLRPTVDGFDEFDGDRPTTVHYRIDTVGAHPLQRLGALAGLGKEFEQLEAYEESFEKFDEAKEKYDTDYEAYLAFHRKKNGKPEPEAEADAEPATEEAGAEAGGENSEEGGEKPAAEEGSETPETPKPEGRRPRKNRPSEKPAEKPAADAPASGSQDGDKKGGDKKDGDEPKKPDFPKEPKREPAKDALIALRDGDARLFVEARHPDDIRKATEIIQEQELGDAVLEAGDGAVVCAEEIAPYFRGVVVTRISPLEKSPIVGAEGEGKCLVVELERAGIPVAIASGSIARALSLRNLAAEAVGRGLSEQNALRSITLTPAEFLGIQEQVGSLTRGKLADMNIFSGPIFDPSSRPVAVFRAGVRISLEN